MRGFHDVVKTSLLALIAGCALYSTYLLHLVVEERRIISVLHVRSPDEFNPMPVRIMSTNNPLSVQGEVRLQSGQPIDVTVKYPIDLVGPVEVYTKRPQEITTPALRPLEVRPVR